MPILHPAQPPPQAPNSSRPLVVAVPEDVAPSARSAHGGGRPASVQPQVVSSRSSLFGHQDRSTLRSDYRRVRRPEPASARVQSEAVVPDLISGSPRRKSQAAAAAAALALGEERAAGGRSQCGRQWHPALTTGSYRSFVDNPNVYSTAGSVLYGVPNDHERRASVAAAEASSPNFSRKGGGVAAGKGVRWNSGKEPGQMSNVALFKGALRRGQAVEHAIPGSNILLPGAVITTHHQHGSSAAPGANTSPCSTRCVAWAEGDSACGSVPPRRPHPAGEWEPLPFCRTEPPPTFLDDFISRRGRKPLHYDELGSGVGYAAAARLTGGGAIVEPTPMLARSPQAAQGEGEAAAAPPGGMPSRGRGPSAPHYGGYGERHIFNVGEAGHRGRRLVSGEAAAAQIAALTAASSSVGATVFGHEFGLRVAAQTPYRDGGLAESAGIQGGHEFGLRAVGTPYSNRDGGGVAEGAGANCGHEFGLRAASQTPYRGGGGEDVNGDNTLGLACELRPPAERLRDGGITGGAGTPPLRALPWYAGSAGMATDTPARQQHPGRPRPPSAARGHMGSTASPAGIHLAGAAAAASWRHAEPPPPDVLTSAIRGKQRTAVAGKAADEPSTQDLIRNSEYGGVPTQNWADHRYRTQLADSIATAKVERAFTRKANAAAQGTTARRGLLSSTAKQSGWRT